MTELDCLNLMIAPGQSRATKWRQGVIQIIITSSCNLSCFNCTQGSNLSRKPWFMTPNQFEQAVLSLKDYWGVVGIFGGCPTIHQQFYEICDILRKHVPYEQRGLWANNPMGKGRVCRETFNPAVSNLNVHMDRDAYQEFKRDWPESMPFGLDKDSRHSPPFVAMKDVIADESKRWELISSCDINKLWSAMIGVFRGEVRAWFCEIAGAQAMLHQNEPDYPDTGLPVEPGWWKLPMSNFVHQVRKHCHECGVPLRGYGELAQAADHGGVEQVSRTHENIYRTKRKGRVVQVVEKLEELGIGRLQRMTDYLQNASK